MPFRSEPTFEAEPRAERSDTGRARVMATLPWSYTDDASLAAMPWPRWRLARVEAEAEPDGAISGKSRPTKTEPLVELDSEAVSRSSCETSRAM